ncbi:enoyl-CoA hydratase/isomerase family protein [Salinirubellus salinus]|uniref:Enoyl-CoA hydratase/isomerase family protein n=1 Tax=Salinirubellus salinus TaxID=1364945 RepID=A0A9E7R711_9EURY|nr:enoyl-CoA hydratase/isomerase family protein [Salinirubellus salinus]UWM56722.1 enoyl-CoA hydratase/isomerase family protein [Salinirubellus salinus]
MIQVERRGDVRVVTLDRPEKRNALTPEGLVELRAAVAEAAAPVVHVTGAGDAFSAGADFDSVAAAAERDDAEAFIRRGQETMRAIEAADSVVVAGVDGPARGGGVELALACDLRVATPDATFAETGVKLGLFGAWGGTHRLPAVVGLGDAIDLSLSGRTLDAESAHRIGLVQRVVEAPFAVSEELAGNDDAALRVLKRRLRAHERIEEQERGEREAFAELLAAYAERLD